MVLRYTAFRLFERFPEYLSFFKQTPPDNTILHNHTDYVLDTVGSLIEIAVGKDLTQFDLQLTNLGRFHINNGVHRKDVEVR